MPFGDGSDGDVVISVNTTLTRDMNYNNLTINAGVTLYPDGYIIYVKNVLTVDGIINRNGNDGLYEHGGEELPTRSVGGSGAGGGTTGPYVGDGVDGDSVSGIACSTGGNGRPRLPQLPGEGGITLPCHTVVCTDLGDILTNAPSRLGGPGGGSAGDYVYSVSGGYGFGGGGGGGVIYCSADEIIINASGQIVAKGGKGGIFSFKPPPETYGGGGGGGCIVLEYNSISNNGAIDVSGGYGYNSGSSGTIYLCEYVPPAAVVINPGCPIHQSTGASVSGGIVCGMGKRRR